MSAVDDLDENEINKLKLETLIRYWSDHGLYTCDSCGYEGVGNPENVCIICTNGFCSDCVSTEEIFECDSCRVGKRKKARVPR